MIRLFLQTELQLNDPALTTGYYLTLAFNVVVLLVIVYAGYRLVRHFLSR